MKTDQLYDAVRQHYSAASKGSSDGKYESTVAKAFGYTEAELASIPKGANLGLSCGNSIAIANLKEGETVIDLGSGAGFDVFLAAKKVGTAGHVIGVDMNKDMLEKANRNKSTANAQNVSFVEAEITKINPLSSGIADCIISNCVINLVPEDEKQLSFNEMARLLKPGGRVAMSDILLKKDLSEDLQRNVALYVGCISGASKIEQYETYLRNAGFQNILIVDTEKDLNVYNSDAGDGSSCCGTQVETKPANSCCGTTVEVKSSCGASKSSASCGDSNRSAGPAKIDPELAKIDFNELAGSYSILAVKS